MPEKKMYKLLGADGKTYLSEEKGEYGGNRETHVYGSLTDCPAARRALSMETRDHYIKNRVFFKDEATALAAGFRPCGSCQREKYKHYKADPAGYKAQFGVK